MPKFQRFVSSSIYLDSVPEHQRRAMRTGRKKERSHGKKTLGQIDEGKRPLRSCLKCDASFKAYNRFNRTCPTCQVNNRHLADTHTEAALMYPGED